MYNFDKEITYIDTLRQMGYDLYFISKGTETLVEFSKSDSNDVLFSFEGELCACIKQGYDKITGSIRQ
jgi:hypothetical protein